MGRGKKKRRELPVVSAPDGGARGKTRPRPSKNARLRAIVLLLVHVVIAAHVTHFLVAGETLSPVEPSESMYTLELGELNAGFVFFIVALLSTALFGRFFCGWGCHVVALQDASAWMLGRLGLRPRPFRTRLLVWVPLVLALYMFAWPTFKRVVLGTAPPFPGFSNHLTTTGFWDTFPGPVMAVLTFITCGFLAVWFLGSKGFCTNACPYGGFFVLLDRISPMRIVVSDACEGCGHCTATCTSNVLVHREVAEHRMVVDPGCMKCMDCVSVCPKDALSVGWARPAVGLAPGASQLPPTQSLVAEIGLLVVCLLVTLAFRGLYDGPPLLMSVALGVISGLLALRLVELWKKPTVRLQSFTLKAGGDWTNAGRVFALAGTAWFLFAAHSGFVQWHRARGEAAIERTTAPRAAVLAGAFSAEAQPASHHEAVTAARRHLGLAERFGLVPVQEIRLGLAYVELLEGRLEPALELIGQTIAEAPEVPQHHENLVEVLLSRRRVPEAIDALRAKMTALGGTEADHGRLTELLVFTGRLDEAAENQRGLVALTPDSAQARYNLGAMLRRLGRPDEALAELDIAVDLHPDDADSHLERGLCLAALEQPAEAVEALRRVLELAPNRPDAAALPALITELESQVPR
ncbi:MAG: tetratricopeptide repeat protein [Acidobacteriota bacterium]